MPETQSDPPLNVRQFIADNGLHVYSDASWNPSHAGHVVMYGNGPVAQLQAHLEAPFSNTIASAWGN